MRRLNSALPIDSSAAQGGCQFKPSLHVLMIVHRRLDEVLLTSIIRQTSHRIHIADSPAMIRHSLDLQGFDLALICDSDHGGIQETLDIFKQHDRGNMIPLIGISSQKALDESLLKTYPQLACLLHPPITQHKLVSILNYFAGKLQPPQAVI